MDITTKGYIQVLDADGALVSRHNDVKEAYESASKAGAGTYTLKFPDQIVKIEAVVCPTQPEPPVDPEPPVVPPVDPPVDPEPEPEPQPEPEPVPTGGLAIDLSFVDKSSAEYASLIALVDSQLAGTDNYGFQAQDAVYAYRLSGDTRYRDLAVRLVDKQVSDAEAKIAAGQKPAVAGDSYLEIGPMLSDLAQTYQFCSPSAAQKTRWKAYADQAVANVWFFNTAKWGNTSFPGNGWGANDPGNNYYYSFCLASVMWGLASGNQTLIDYLKNDRFALLDGYFANLEGGGSREGTGYGLSAKVVFEFAAAWRDSGYAVPANILKHAKASVLFWTHATMPGRTFYAPIGDLARESTPYFMEYHVELVMRAAWLVKDDATSKLAGFWTRNVVRTPDYNRTWARRNALFAPAAGGGNPPTLTYHAKGTGNLFARTGWSATDTAVHVIAGPFDQSHAHQEQGGFTFFAGGKFGAVTNNIFTRSGIYQDVPGHNVLRFVKSGTTLGQRRGDGVSAPLQNITTTDAGGFTAEANLKPVYADASVQAYKRSYSFSGGALEVTDDYTVASGTTAVFQVCTPVKPVVSGNVATAGTLKVTVVEPAGASLSVVTNPQGSDVQTTSFRLDVAGGTGKYVVRLEASA